MKTARLVGILLIVGVTLFSRPTAGQRPAGKGPAGQRPAGKGPAGKGPAGKGPAGKGPAGKRPAGKRGGRVDKAIEKYSPLVPSFIESAKNKVLHDLFPEVDSADLEDAVAKLTYNKQLSLTSALIETAGRAITEASGLKPRHYRELLASLPIELGHYNVDLQPDAVYSAPVLDKCPWSKSYDCPTNDKYRTADGSCNNRDNPYWGRTQTPLRRDITATFNDAITSFRKAAKGKSDLPSARLISSRVAIDKDNTATGITDLFTQFGQMTDHDISLTPTSSSVDCGTDGCDETDEQCAPIIVPKNDPVFGGEKCIKFVRSVRVPDIACSLGAQQNLNAITSYIDASFVYGSTATMQSELRVSDPTRGGLRVKAGSGGHKDLLPDNTNDSGCKRMNRNQVCFKAGDVRANVQPLMALQHVVWLRMHNALEYRLHRLNPVWDGEKLFQETRKIVGAFVQHVTYNEFLPLLLGQDNLEKYDLELQTGGFFTGYDKTVDASISNSFATAAYRYGHSMISNVLERRGKDYVEDVSAQLSNVFFRSEELRKGLDSLLRGMVTQKCQKTDRFFAKDITEHMFTTNPPFGLGTDLVSLNIQRGRDNGIPGYIEWRKSCGLPAPKKNFKHLGDLPKKIRKQFKELYKKVEDIDIFIAGVAENNVEGGLVGPTFACMIGRQFRDLKFGDRFWYETPKPEGFSLDQLNEIRKITLSRILCSMSEDVATIQPRAFRLPTKTGDNARVECSSLPDIDISKWADGR